MKKQKKTKKNHPKQKKQSKAKIIQPKQKKSSKKIVITKKQIIDKIEKIPTHITATKKAIIKSLKKPKIILTKKMLDLLDVPSLEDILFLAETFNYEELNALLGVYKTKKEKNKNIAIDRILSQSKNSEDLLSNLANELKQNLTDEHSTILSSLSELRKKGHDVLIEDLKAHLIPNKIRIFLATRTKKDLYVVKKQLSEPTSQIEVIKSKEIPPTLADKIKMTQDSVQKAAPLISSEPDKTTLSIKPSKSNVNPEKQKEGKRETKLIHKKQKSSKN